MRAIKKGEISVKMVYTVTFIGLFLIFAYAGQKKQQTKRFFLQSQEF